MTTSTRTHRWGKRLAATSFVFVLAACTGGDDAAPDTGSEAPHTTAAASEANEPSVEPSVAVALEPSGTITATGPAEILEVYGTPDGTNLTVAFEMGDAACNGFEVMIDESTTDVVVAMTTGPLGDVDPLSCEFGIHPYTTGVELAEPLGTRRIVPAERAEPVEQTATAFDGPGSDVDFLIGAFVEDGVEWADANEIDWRVISFDGETIAEQPAPDSGRIAFVVVRDRIAAYEWS